MRRPLQLAIVSLGGAVAALTTRCGTQTQLIVEVSTDAIDCNRLDTGIFVGKTSADTNDLAGPRVSKRGCERPGFIGSAVFLPRDADDEAFAIKIITAVDATVTECVTGAKQTCIVERRAVQYESGSIVRVAVSMDQQCIGIKCAPKESCTRGVCVPCTDCVDQTGADAGKEASGSVDAAIDAGPCPTDVCTGSCNGPNNLTCNVNCTSTKCEGTTVRCPPNRHCVVECNATEKHFCKDMTIDCTDALSCDVQATGAFGDQLEVSTVKCGPGPCRIVCTNGAKACSTVTIEAADTPSFCLECVGTETCQTMGDCGAPANKCTANCSGCKEPACTQCATRSDQCPPVR